MLSCSRSVPREALLLVSPPSCVIGARPRLTGVSRRRAATRRPRACRNHHCPTCRLHVPSRRVLRDDPEFDAIITALYANARDYDARENAYSAQVTKEQLQSDKEEKERERQAKKRRMEQAAAEREKLKKQMTEQAASATASAAVAPAAAAPAVAAPAVGPPQEEAPAASSAPAALPHDAPPAPVPAPTVQAPKPAPAPPKPAPAATQPPPAKKPVGRPKGSGAAVKAPAVANTAPPVPPPQPRGRPPASMLKIPAVVEMPDDFAGLFAARVADDNARAELERWEAAKSASAPADSLTLQVELRQASARTPELPMPFISCPAAATVGTLRRLVSAHLNVPEKKVFIMHSTAGGNADVAGGGGLGLDVKMTLKDALAGKLAAAEELAFSYSVVG